MGPPKHPQIATPASDRGVPVNHTVRRVTSGELLAGARELIIEHDGRDYRMRVTQNGKLILTA